MADIATAEMPNTRKARTSRKALKAKTPSTNEANILAGTVSEAAAPSPIPTDPAKNHQSLSQPRTSPKKATKASKKQSKAAKEKETAQSSFEKDLQEMEEKLQALRLEKEKTEELLKEKDEILKLKEEELESKGREQDKLQMELKKLQKSKEFKPTMVRFLETANISFRSSIFVAICLLVFRLLAVCWLLSMICDWTFEIWFDEIDNEFKWFIYVQALPIIPSQKDKKKKGGPEMKRPSPPYVLWCKDQWNQVENVNIDDGSEI